MSNVMRNCLSCMLVCMPTDSEHMLEHEIPEEISMETLSIDILGFPLSIRDELPASKEDILSESDVA